MVRKVDDLKGVGPKLKKTLNDLGIVYAKDLLFYWPRRYEDYSTCVKVSQLQPGKVTIQAQLSAIKSKYVKRGMHITEATAEDDSGKVKIVWFNQPYRAASILAGRKYFISGEFGKSVRSISIINPSIELTDEMPKNTARILPVYKEKPELSSKTLRKLYLQLDQELRLLKETLPAGIVSKFKLISFAEAIKAVHLPESGAQLELAKSRLGFEEIFGYALASQLTKNNAVGLEAPQIKFDDKLAKKFVSSLAFALTDAQRKAAWQVLRDLDSQKPMNRLIEGDVGSGKTVVAAMAAAMSLGAGYKTVLLAPTEMLAKQHADSISEILGHCGYADKVILLTGSSKSADRKNIMDKLTGANSVVAVGTHALLTDGVNINKLGLIIIDEQHRFGVDQRKKLQHKSGYMPHVLTMTATPIPRSLALTIYGELDLSIINQLPPGRKPVITKIVSPNSRDQIYKKIILEALSGRHSYIVCPLIEKSDKISALSAEQVYETLSKGPLKSLRVGLVHGSMNQLDKDLSMKKFKEGLLDVLVSTSVIEVGVNVPEASVMVIEGAERFGLAQLHQLRGRVARSTHQSYCYVVPSDSQAPSKRLRMLELSTNGFELAEYDLELRGPGAIYGTRQSGQLDLNFAKITDSELITKAREAANYFIKSKLDLKKYPNLNKRVEKSSKVISLN